MESRGNRGPRDPRGPRGPRKPDARRSGPGGRGPSRGNQKTSRSPQRLDAGKPEAAKRGTPKPSVDERLSKFLAFLLRHHPEIVNVALDERGAADLNALTTAVRTRPGFEEITRERIELLATTGPAALRFEVIGNTIRARYGHSLTQPIQYEPAEPPEHLFHGTTPERAAEILAAGLKPADRQRVHLSSDTPAALEVGLRRSPEPVILRVDTQCAQKAGVKFYCAGPAVWLSDEIPPGCIDRVE